MAEECDVAEITLRRPDDWHHHLRDGDVLADTVRAASRQFARAIIMPNLVPPVSTAAMAAQYKSRIAVALAASGAPAGSFIPLMTLYLTDSTTPDEIRAAAAAGDVKAVKLYPAGATTNSDSGVTDYAKVQPALVAMAELGMPLCVHGEVTDPAVDVFDRERVFVRTKLPQLLALAPGLKIVLEHLSTREAVEAVMAEGSSIAGTLTPQHLLVSAAVGGAGRLVMVGVLEHWHVGLGYGMGHASAPRATTGRHPSLFAQLPTPCTGQSQRHAFRRHPPPPVLPAHSQNGRRPAGTLGSHPVRMPAPILGHRLGAARHRCDAAAHCATTAPRAPHAAVHSPSPVVAASPQTPPQLQCVSALSSPRLHPRPPFPSAPSARLALARALPRLSPSNSHFSLVPQAASRARAAVRVSSTRTPPSSSTQRPLRKRAPCSTSRHSAA
jgi:hypothetical protein